MPILSINSPENGNNGNGTKKRDDKEKPQTITARLFLQFQNDSGNGNWRKWTLAAGALGAFAIAGGSVVWALIRLLTMLFGGASDGVPP